MRAITAFSVFCLSFFLIADLFAQEASDSSSENSPPRVSLTSPPLFLIEPMLEVMCEVSLTNRTSFAIIGGIGESGYESELLLSAGCQYQRYLVGNFQHGIQLGLQALYTRVGESADWLMRLNGNTVGLGPFLGYKGIIEDGFTLNLQIGPQLVYGDRVPAKVYREIISQRPQPDTFETGVWFFANLNMGWSF